MVTQSFELVQEQTTIMDIKELTNEERRTLFIKKSSELKREGLKYVQLANAIGMNEKRMRNIRSTKPPHVFPTRIELDALGKLHERRFAPKKEKNETIQEQLKDLQERMLTQEAFNESKKLQILEKMLELAEKQFLSPEELKELRRLLQ